MLIDFFLTLRAHGLPVSLREHLDLLAVLEAGLGDLTLDSFYGLGRTVLVKDEAHYDRFDRAFAAYVEGIETPAEITGDAPAAWFADALRRHVSDEERRRIEALGGFDTLMETLRRRLAEQKGRHQGGSKWLGTGGASPFGAYGYNPEGVRIGQGDSRERRAVKVWDRRQFKDLDGDAAIDTRTLRVALRRLRRFAREGAAEELDLEGTIDGTAKNAGLLDLKLRPERRNAIKVLMLFDVGGSMDGHVRTCERLFSAARSEFKHLEYRYFHNCLYETVWQSNRRRHAEREPTRDLLHRFGPDWKVILVGDATMSAYEITHAGGANEGWNAEPGGVWLERLRLAYPHSVWLNPERQDWWPMHASIGLIRTIFAERMHPLTLAGLDAAIRDLRP